MSRFGTPGHLIVARNFFAPLVRLLGFDRHRRDGPGDQPVDADRLAGDLAPAVLALVDPAQRRIDEGEYGYCEVTGEPISLGRLEARPIATMTVEAQERHERQERVSRDD